MTSVLRVVQLDDLLHLFRLDNQLHTLDLLLNSSLELFIKCLLELNVREQVVKQRVEQWDIFFDELGQVHISDGFHQDQHLLIQLLLLQFFQHLFVLLVHLIHRRLDVRISPDRTCTCQHGLDSSEPKVVMILFRQLLRHKLIQDDNLVRDHLAILETL